NLLVEDIKRIEGEDGTLWRYVRAGGLILDAEKGDRKGLPEARDLLTTVASRRSAWARVAVAQAQVLDLLGNPDAALARYRQAAPLGERSPAVIGGLVQLLAERHLYAEAEQLLQKLRERTTTLGELDRVAAELALRRDDSGQALQLAQQAVPADSKDFRRHVW